MSEEKILETEEMEVQGEAQAPISASRENDEIPAGFFRRSKEPKWYVVHTYSGHENKVKVNLEKLVENRGMQDLVLQIIVPTEDRVEFKDNQRTVKTRKIFPGYVIVKMIVTNESWYLVRNTQGDEYRDGQVTLLVRQGERTVFSRTFRKEDFSQLVPSKFMDTSALVGFSYNYTKLDDHSALYFIATVGDPDETADIAYPVQVRITPAGTMTMEKATNLDTEPINPMTIDPSDDGGI